MKDKNGGLWIIMSPNGMINFTPQSGQTQVLNSGAIVNLSS